MDIKIICLFHGSREFKEYEQLLVDEVKDKFSNYSVDICYYSKVFEKFSPNNLEVLLDKYSNCNVFILNVILSSGYNYEKILKRVKSDNVYTTLPLLKYNTTYLDKEILYIAHGSDNEDFINLKSKYNVIYLDEINEDNTKDYLKIHLLFLSRSKHAFEVLNNEYVKERVKDSVLLESKYVRRLLLAELEDLINEN